MINDKFIIFNTKESFETLLEAGNILPTSIVFIKDPKIIWTQGEYFYCDEDAATSITQETGLSETDVMSQKAVTNSLSNLQDQMFTTVDDVIIQ